MGLLPIQGFHFKHSTSELATVRFQQFRVGGASGHLPCDAFVFHAFISVAGIKSTETGYFLVFRDAYLRKSNVRRAYTITFFKPSKSQSAELWEMSISSNTPGVFLIFIFLAHSWFSKNCEHLMGEFAF